MGVLDHWLSMACFWVRGKPPMAADNGTQTNETGFSRAMGCVDDDNIEPVASAQTQTGIYEGQNGLQRCGSCANAGNCITASGSRDEALHDLYEGRREESRESLREQLGPNILMEESSRGRQLCACFAYSSIDRVKKEWDSMKNFGNIEGRECSHRQSGLTQGGQPVLPDDVMELCLARMSFSALARARTVCKKWRDLTMSPHFLVCREALLLRKPWLLLFGLSKDGVTSSGEIHALDTSSNQWHLIQADVLSGRFLFSVVSLNGLIYVLGGCSSLSDRNGNPDKGNIKTHKGVRIYNPFMYSWTKGCSMSSARAMAITGVFEVKPGGMNQKSKSRGFGRCQCKGLDGETEANLSASSDGERKQWGNQGEIAAINSTYQPSSCQKSDIARGSAKQAKRNGLIVVGGQGLWSQPLYSAEIYDPFTNTWREVARLPADHGITRAGVVCNGLFYVYSETDKLAAYDFDLNVWINIQVSTTMTRLREYAPKLVSCKGKLILLGVAWGLREGLNGTGNEAEVAMRMLWEFHQNSQTWQQFAIHPDAPLDLNAVFVSEGNQIHGLEMFKIFGQVLDFVTVCDLSGSEMIWMRMSRMRLGNDLDVSSCVTKTAVVVNL